MSRNRRPYLPGAVFHLTARTLGKEQWFTDESIRTRIISLIGEACERCDARLIALAIMSNHFHILIQQGTHPLAQLMHPIVRRTALVVQRAIGREGYIFERRFRSQLCQTADHMRNAILYTHWNPPEAGLCVDPAEYRWCTHRVYAGLSVEAPLRDLSVQTPLQIFASRSNQTLEQDRADYLQWMAWRAEVQKHKRNPERVPYPPEPPVNPGDANWARDFRVPVVVGEQTARRPDLDVIVLRALADDYSWLDLETLRSRRGGPAIVAARHDVIRRARLAGYRGVQIARFLNCSEETVSRATRGSTIPPRVAFGTAHVPV